MDINLKYSKIGPLADLKTKNLLVTNENEVAIRKLKYNISI
tara:strand:- start:1044 stop:1166 length:123 start_codon:yes stop_codon:yes gene_type:complete